MHSHKRINKFIEVQVKPGDVIGMMGYEGEDLIAYTPPDSHSTLAANLIYVKRHRLSKLVTFIEFINYFGREYEVVVLDKNGICYLNCDSAHYVEVYR